MDLVLESAERYLGFYDGRGILMLTGCGSSFGKDLGVNCHAPGFDVRRRGTAHPVIKYGTGCWTLSPAQV
ncbi:hypothetical protein YC2023_019060 [Brassica napus]